jgi:hypothetical protein
MIKIRMKKIREMMRIRRNQSQNREVIEITKRIRKKII